MTLVPPDPSLVELAAVLRCLLCGGREFLVAADALTCRSCHRRLDVRDGILHVESPNEDRAVTRERAAVREMDDAPLLRPTDFSLPSLLADTAALRDAFASLPYADGSAFYRENEYFKNVARFAGVFDYVVRHLGCPPGGRVLDVGADLTWSTARLAVRGWRAVGIDINHHLAASQVLRACGPAYAVVNVDMHLPAFGESSFHAATAFNALHHTHRIEELVGTLSRAIQPGGRFGIVEPYWYVEEVRDAFGAAQIEAGINENVYRLEEWHRFFVQAGFELVTFMISHSFNAIYQKRPAGLPPRILTVEEAETELFEGHYRVAFRAPPELTGSVPTGCTIRVPVTIINNARAGWSSEGQIPVFLSYHLYRIDGPNRVVIAYDNARTALPGYVAAGSTADVELPIAVPNAPGEYQADLDLVHEGRCWFAEKGGQVSTITLHARSGSGLAA